MKTKLYAPTKLICAVALSLLGAANAYAQTPNPPFSLLGFVEEFKLWDNATFGSRCPGVNSVFRGATMKVNGISVTIPCHLIVLFPAAAFTPEDIFRGAKATQASDPVVAKSGLAIADAPDGPLVPFEAQIAGNIVNGEYIAGLVKITQQDLNATGGFIQDINPVTGELLVGAGAGGVGARVRLNDNDNRFGAGDANADKRFGADTENPTVTAETGYPMCIPSNTAPNCPKPPFNRPKRSDGTFRTRFTIGSVANNGNGTFEPAPACAAGEQCDPAKMVPFVKGDYIVYSGTMAKDAQGMYVSAHTIHSTMGIFTSPCAPPAITAGCNSPVYVSIEEVLIGTAGTAFTGIDVELGPGRRKLTNIEPAATLKVVAFTTDPSQQLEIVAIDHNATTHAELSPLRKITNFTPQDIPFGRARTGFEQFQLLPPPREYEVRIAGYDALRAANDPRVRALANGLEPGRYLAPVAEYIFPENKTFGQPLYPMNFENFCYLRRGSGMYTGLGRSPGLPIGALLPFPESGHPNPQSNPVCN